MGKRYNVQNQDPVALSAAARPRWGTKLGEGMKYTGYDATTEIPTSTLGLTK